MYKDIEGPKEIMDLPNRLNEIKIACESDKAGDEDEIFSLNVPLVFSQLQLSLEKEEFIEVSECYHVLFRYMHVREILLYPAFISQGIPDTIRNCFKLNPAVYQEPKFSQSIQVITDALYFIQQLFIKKQQNLLEYIIDEEFAASLLYLKQNVKPGFELAEIFTYMLKEIAEAHKDQECDFIKDVCDPGFFKLHIKGTKRTKSYLCRLLHNMAEFKDSYTIFDDMIDIIDTIRNDLGDEDGSAKEELVRTMISITRIKYNKSKDDETMSMFLSELIDRGLLDFGFSLFDSRYPSEIDAACGLFVALGTCTDFDESSVYPKIIEVLKRDDEQCRITGYEMLALVCNSNDTMAIKTIQYNELIGVALEGLQEGSQLLKKQVGFFFCGLLKNTGQEFLASIVDTNFFEDMLDIFRCLDNDFCDSFVRHLYKALARVTDEELKQHILDKFVECEGLDTFNEVSQMLSDEDESDVPFLVDTFLSMYFDEQDSDGD